MPVAVKVMLESAPDKPLPEAQVKSQQSQHSHSKEHNKAERTSSKVSKK